MKLGTGMMCWVVVVVAGENVIELELPLHVAKKEKKIKRCK